MNQDFKKKKQTKTRVEKRQKLILNQSRGRGVCVDYKLWEGEGKSVLLFIYNLDTDIAVLFDINW